MNVGRPRKAKVSSIRRTLWLVCVATTVVPAVSTRAEDQIPVWATGCISVARESFTKESRVPEGYDRSEIQKLLFPEAMVIRNGRVEVPWLLFVKPWRASPGLSVAVLQTVTYENGQGRFDYATTLYLAVFAGGTSGAKADIRARGQVDSVPERYLRELDLAPYRLARDKLAFGVRTFMNWPLVGGGGQNEYLLLFVQDGQELKKVWATLMGSWRMSNDGYNDDGSSNKAEEGHEGTAVVSVLKTATGGFRDLRKSGWSKRPVVYRWNGERYVAKDRDPVENVNGWPEAEVEAEVE
jgi:hypothetical protein